MTDRYLIVGLGNPGKKYENTRHNVGFMVVDELARKYGLTFDKTERKALTADGVIKEKRVLLVKPQTYMNLSGESVRGLIDFYKIDLDRLIVVHDDLDTPAGILRIRKTGGHGGQNGVRNIIQQLGTQEFARVRFGIDRPPGRMKPVDYVLTPYKGDDEILLREVIDRAVKALETWLTDGVEVAMSQYNGDVESNNHAPQPDPEEQLALYQRAHELAPNDPAPLEKLAGVLKRLGRMEEAADVHARIAELHVKAGSPVKARTEWERAASLNPALVAVHERIVESYLEAGNARKAVSRYLILADSLAKRGDIAAALQAAQAALKINPQHPKALEKVMALQKQLTM